MAKKKINSLQVLRAFAVTLVVFIHVVNYSLEHSIVKPYLGTHFNFRYWGAIGVDLFFVISGFIMTIVVPSYFIKNGLQKFFIKRIARIVPLYYLFAALATAITIYKHTFIVNTLIKTIIFLPIFDKKVFVIPFIGVGWSLSYEIYFYLLIAVFLSFKERIYVVLVSAIIVLSVIGAIINPSVVLLRFITSPLLIEFGMGIICGLIYKKMHDRGLTSNIFKIGFTCLALIGLGLMVSSIFAQIKPIYLQEVIENDNPLALNRAIIWGVPCAMFLLGVVMMENHLSFNFHSIFVKIGDASYSCYLLHGFLFPFFFKVLHNSMGFLGPDIFVFLDIIFCIFISAIFYKYVETFIVKNSDKLLQKV